MLPWLYSKVHKLYKLIIKVYQDSQLFLTIQCIPMIFQSTQQDVFNILKDILTTFLRLKYFTGIIVIEIEPYEMI